MAHHLRIVRLVPWTMWEGSQPGERSCDLGVADTIAVADALVVVGTPDVVADDQDVVVGVRDAADIPVAVDG